MVHGPDSLTKAHVHTPAPLRARRSAPLAGDGQGRGLRRGLRRAQRIHRRVARRGQGEERAEWASRRAWACGSSRGAQVGYAYSDDLDDEALAPGRHAPPASSPREEAASRPSTSRARPLPTFYRVPVPLAQVEVAHKRDLVVRANAAARKLRPKRVKQVMATYADSTKRILVANTRGHLAEDAQDLCRISAMVVAEGKGGERRTGSFGGGGRVPFTHFDTFTPELVAREAARQALATAGRGGGGGRPADGGAGARAGAASSSTRPWGTGSRPTSFARAPRCSPGSWARRWPASWSPSSTTARWPTRAARSTSTTRGTRRSSRCSSSAAC